MIHRQFPFRFRSPRSMRPPVTIIIAMAVLALFLGAGVTTVASKTITCALGDVCAGTNKADTIRGEGANLLQGKGGNDTITSRGFSRVIGGGGNDKIRAFAMATELSGDDIRGGKGNDVINTINDIRDVIDCGPGKDTVRYDILVDQTVNCETLLPE